MSNSPIQDIIVIVNSYITKLTNFNSFIQGNQKVLQISDPYRSELINVLRMFEDFELKVRTSIQKNSSSKWTTVTTLDANQPRLSQQQIQQQQQNQNLVNNSIQQGQPNHITQINMAQPGAQNQSHNPTNQPSIQQQQQQQQNQGIGIQQGAIQQQQNQVNGIQQAQPTQNLIAPAGAQNQFGNTIIQPSIQPQQSSQSCGISQGQPNQMGQNHVGSHISNQATQNNQAPPISNQQANLPNQQPKNQQQQIHKVKQGSQISQNNQVPPILNQQINDQPTMQQQPNQTIQNQFQQQVLQLAVDKQISKEASVCFQIDKDDCIVCIEQLFNDENIVVMLKCGHSFHLDCISQCIIKSSLKCPVCNTIYGQMYGDQPDGTMKCYKSKSSCSGYKCGSIVIEYYFKPGSINGVHYYGTQRQAFLPDNSQGQYVLSLLQQAFDQKLTFTIGRSVTTGADNQIVWNGIHHKTSQTGGAAYYGYPDDTYLNRVQYELSAKGIK